MGWVARAKGMWTRWFWGTPHWGFPGQSRGADTGAGLACPRVLCACVTLPGGLELH